MRRPTWLLAGLGLALATSVYAGLEDIAYPIAELGGCENQDACFAYCDEPAHQDACMAFARANDLIEEEQIREYQQMQEAIQQGGPGGCTSEATCEAYCSDLNNMRECLAFAEEHGIMDATELEEAKKVQAALDAGYSMPGGCTSESECEAYCSDAANMEECLNFASASGFMSQEEIAQARQVMTIMQSGASPGGCRNEAECDAYCQDETHMEECLQFGVDTGFMTAQEAQEIRQSGSKLDEFAGPGGCTDEESCRAYCEDEANRDACAAFFGGETHTDEPIIDSKEDLERALEVLEGDLEGAEMLKREWEQGAQIDREKYIGESGGFSGAPTDPGNYYDLETGGPIDESWGEDDASWEEFDLGDIPLQLVPGSDGSDKDDESEKADDSKEEHSLILQPDAGFVESVKRFLFELVGRVN